MRKVSPLSKPFVWVGAGLWVIIGADSSRVPFFPTYIWQIAFIAIAIGLVHMVYRPDKRKLRMIAALSCTVGLLRGIVLSIDQHRLGPVALWLLIAMLTTSYYLVRAPQLPERYEDDT